MSEAQTVTPPQAGALKVRRACQFLDVSRSTLNRLMKEGQIKPNRKLRHLLIPLSELERWLNE